MPWFLDFQDEEKNRFLIFIVIVLTDFGQMWNQFLRILDVGGRARSPDYLF
jgi:hypothetical protein